MFSKFSMGDLERLIFFLQLHVLIMFRLHLGCIFGHLRLEVFFGFDGSLQLRREVVHFFLRIARVGQSGEIVESSRQLLDSICMA